MGVTKEQISPGSGTDKAQKGDTITMEYTGNLYDPNAANKKGKQFDSSVGRGDFKTKIGTGQVIKGWDEGVLNVDGGMTLGEKATLTITGDYAYGSQGFPGLIPPNSTLVFDVQLKAINNKKISQQRNAAIIAEPLSIVTGALQVAGAGLSLAKTLYDFIEIIKTANKHVSAIAAEVKLTSSVLQHLGTLLGEHDNQRLCSASIISDAGSAFKGCEDAFRVIEEVFKPLLKKQADGTECLSMSGKFSWPLKKTKLESLQANLERLKTTLLLMLSVVSYARDKAWRATATASEFSMEKLQILNLMKAKKDATERCEKVNEISHFDDRAAVVTTSSQAEAGAAQANTSPFISLGFQEPTKPDQSPPVTDGQIRGTLALCAHVASQLLKAINVASSDWTSHQELDTSAIQSRMDDLEPLTKDIYAPDRLRRDMQAQEMFKQRKTGPCVPEYASYGHVHELPSTGPDRMRAQHISQSQKQTQQKQDFFIVPASSKRIRPAQQQPDNESKPLPDPAPPGPSTRTSESELSNDDHSVGQYPDQGTSAINQQQGSLQASDVNRIPRETHETAHAHIAHGLATGSAVRGGLCSSRSNAESANAPIYDIIQSAHETQESSLALPNKKRVSMKRLKRDDMSASPADIEADGDDTPPRSPSSGLASIFDPEIFDTADAVDTFEIDDHSPVDDYSNIDLDTELFYDDEANSRPATADMWILDSVDDLVRRWTTIKV